MNKAIMLLVFVALSAIACRANRTFEGKGSNLVLGDNNAVIQGK